MTTQTKTKDLAHGKWHFILSKLGIHENYLVNKHGPCPICEGKDRYRWDDFKGDGGYFCNQCRAGDGFKLLMEFHNWNFIETCRRVEEVLGVVRGAPNTIKEPVDSEKNKSNIDKLITRTRLAKLGSPVFDYLIGRGLSKIPPTIGYCPDLYESETKKKYMGMVCRIVDVNGDTVSLHRTFLTYGKKANIKSPRKMMPPIGTINGAAIRLFPIPKDGCLGVAEGIENALAAWEIFDIPCWACSSAGNLETFKPPKEIKTVIIFGDNDLNERGKVAAYVLRDRLVKEGLKVEINLPTQAGNDWLDELKLINMARK